MREAISKKLRFEIFKRDEFTCSYCGNTPPKVVLEVDHIIPVCKGGTNTEDNLTTSCFDCNRGKGGNELNATIPNIEHKAALAKEKELQYKAYRNLIGSIEKRVNAEIELVSNIYSSAFPDHQLTDVFKYSSVKSFIKELGIHEVQNAMYKACMKVEDAQQCTKYFCGICWNIIKNKGRG